MRILITGNMGYVGPVLCAHLRKNIPEATLWGVDLGLFAHCLTGAGRLPESILDTQWFGDTRSVKSPVLHDVDAIVHLAAISNDPMGNTFTEQTLEVNHRASVRLAQQAKELGVSTFVFASSCSVYGFSENGICDETSALNPLTPYARSKMLTEQELESLASPEFKVTNLRFATACGMSPRLRLDLVLNDFVASAVRLREISILSDGTPWRPLIHLKDMARAMEWGIRRPLSSGGNCLTVNAGSDDWNYQIKDLAQAVAEQIPGTQVRINSNAQPDKRSYQVSFRRYRELAPEFQPQVDLAEAVRELRQGIEGLKDLPADFRNSSLMRLKVLNFLRTQGALSENLEWSSPSEGRSESVAP